MKLSFNIGDLVKNYCQRLREIRDAPHAVAGGVAIGIFLGFTPLLGLKTLLSIFFAWVFRCSKTAAAIAVSLHDVLTPIWPVILRWEYDLGYWIISHPHHFPQKLVFTDAHMAHWLHLSTLQILWPTFLGSLLFATPAALLFYWITKLLLVRHQLKRQRESK